MKENKPGAAYCFYYTPVFSCHSDYFNSCRILYRFSTVHCFINSVSCNNICRDIFSVYNIQKYVKSLSIYCLMQLRKRKTGI
jgi:hypothetical protein